MPLARAILLYSRIEYIEYSRYPIPHLGESVNHSVDTSSHANNVRLPDSTGRAPQPPVALHPLSGKIPRARPPRAVSHVSSFQHITTLSFLPSASSCFFPFLNYPYPSLHINLFFACLSQWSVLLLRVGTKIKG